MSEPFSFKKMIFSPLTGMYWVKVLMMVFGVSTLSFVGYGVYKAYFKKPPETQNQIIQIASPQAGSTINFSQQSNAKKSLFNPFSEVFIEGLHDLSSDGAFETKIGIRIGLHF